jgi:CRP-like cAMP-binding protein
METLQDTTRNRLLAALPDEVCERWLHSLERVELAAGRLLYESGVGQSWVYFPTTAVVSLVYESEDGHSAEVSLVGSEGVVGVAVFMGGGSSTMNALVQASGQALRAPARTVKAAFEGSPIIRRVLLLYTQARATQIAQTAVCNRHHSVDQQLCRWLLQSLDRLGGSELQMTHELIANLLGVRREGVTEAASGLQKAGLIRYARGHIAVLDRAGLEARACECYQVVRNEYDRLLWSEALAQGVPNRRRGIGHAHATLRADVLERRSAAR